MATTILIDNYVIPDPDQGLKITLSTMVNSSRNANNVLVGERVGRDLYKIDGLQWSFLQPDQWQKILQVINPFYVNVTFTNPFTGERLTIKMYPEDREGEPVMDADGHVIYYKNCKFNLIDVGA